VWDSMRAERAGDYFLKDSLYSPLFLSVFSAFL
jgi:hypothetical protein